MGKNIHLVFILLISYNISSLAQDSVVLSAPNIQQADGYYQTIDLSPDTPCYCDFKTSRNEQLNTRLEEKDLENYQLHAYKYSFGESMTPASKLFHAFEKDTSVYKISFSMGIGMFLILTASDFDIVSFEMAAKKAFKEIAALNPLDYLYKKNRNFYDAYLGILAKKEKEYKQ